MKKYLYRPFHDLSDAIFPLKRLFGPSHHSRGHRNDFITKSYEQLEKIDPHDTFKRFFKENQMKDQSQKQFFKKFFPQSATDNFDPYKVLEISNDATLDQAKEAYRKLAIKYHPKNNTSPDAQAKFTDIAKAYQTILQKHNEKNLDILGFRSFFQDFEKEIESFFEPKAEVQGKSGKEGEKTTKDFGELYSQSTSYETVDGKTTKFIAEKLYKKNGKLLKVTRQEKLKEDGNVEITQTIDNGQEVKRKNYTQERGKKIKAA